MITILLSVLFSTTLFVILKLFSRFQIDTLQALVVNYFTAFALGYFLTGDSFQFAEIIKKPWYPGSLVLGGLFIATFYVMALTSQRNGLSVASVASKMSVIIPICFGLLLYDETLGIIKIIGIVLALVAVYFTSKKEEGTVKDTKNIWFPALVFLGAGTIDAGLKVMQNYYLEPNEISLFSSHTFFIAFCVGAGIIIIRVLKYDVKIKGINLLGGIVLGLPNYFSLYYMIAMLENDTLESSTIFTINNVAIVVLSTIVGILFFRERISWRNGLGIGLALLAIGLVTL